MKDTTPSVGYRAAASAPGALPDDRTALLVIDPVNDFLRGRRRLGT